MYTAMKLLYGCGLALKTALVTDGRFSGTNNGCFVGHVSPEAAEGGPLAIVADGDTITVDIPARRLHLHVSDAEIQARLSRWQRPAVKVRNGYLALTRVWPSRPIRGRLSGIASSRRESTCTRSPLRTPNPHGPPRVCGTACWDLPARCR